MPVCFYGIVHTGGMCSFILKLADVFWSSKRWKYLASICCGPAHLGPWFNGIGWHVCPWKNAASCLQALHFLGHICTVNCRSFTMLVSKFFLWKKADGLGAPCQLLNFFSLTNAVTDFLTSSMCKNRPCLFYMAVWGDLNGTNCEVFQYGDKQVALAVNYEPVGGHRSQLVA